MPEVGYGLCHSLHMELTSGWPCACPLRSIRAVQRCCFNSLPLCVRACACACVCVCVCVQCSVMYLHCLCSVCAVQRDVFALSEISFSMNTEMCV